eukprot:TRINITY_DN1973_c0_g1_i1.p1 TRINITY_DN1973_c0_g1~~TRINITY_DN1973_c0_g1_i1.p1  ORF type:complete len:670 (+),score=126.64 TRINITY_DN1973_c0_g1_i1:77-2011(+)
MGREALPEVREAKIGTQPDHWAALGVPRDADKEAVTKAFRRLASQLHPDRHRGDDEATRRFQLVSDAYSVLSSPAAAAQYRTACFGAAAATPTHAPSYWQASAHSAQWWYPQQAYAQQAFYAQPFHGYTQFAQTPNPYQAFQNLFAGAFPFAEPPRTYQPQSLSRERQRNRDERNRPATQPRTECSHRPNPAPTAAARREPAAADRPAPEKTEPAKPEPPTGIAVGDCVTVVDLQSAPELNGMGGRVLSGQGNRLTVQFDVEGLGVKAVKRVNLVRQGSDAAGDGDEGQQEPGLGDVLDFESVAFDGDRAGEVEPDAEKAGHGAAAAAPAAWGVGAVVKLHSLQRLELNGRLAVVVMRQATPDRLTVRCLDGHLLRVRAGNMKEPSAAEVEKYLRDVRAKQDRAEAEVASQIKAAREEINRVLADLERTREPSPPRVETAAPPDTPSPKKPGFRLPGGRGEDSAAAAPLLKRAGAPLSSAGRAKVRRLDAADHAALPAHRPIPKGAPAGKAAAVFRSSAPAGSAAAAVFRSSAPAGSAGQAAAAVFRPGAPAGPAAAVFGSRPGGQSIPGRGTLGGAGRSPAPGRGAKVALQTRGLLKKSAAPTVRARGPPASPGSAPVLFTPSSGLPPRPSRGPPPGRGRNVF